MYGVEGRLMKEWLRGLLSRIGLAAPVLTGEKVEYVDPGRLLFTVPTISNDLAPLAPLGSTSLADDLEIDEDDWCQVEFFRDRYLPELQRILEEYHTFEASHRQTTTMGGRQLTVWRRTYVRVVSREPLLFGDRLVERLAHLLNGEMGPAPVLVSTGSGVGRVKDGFTLSVGRHVVLYGYVAEGEIPVLAAFVGDEPDGLSLSSAFSRLYAALGLVLVDWRAQFILVGANDGGTVRIWQPERGEDSPESP